MIRVAIAGGFDPFHEGHLAHMKDAASLGDYLLVMINKDEAMIAKKGRCFAPLWFRMMNVEAWMNYLNIQGEVIIMRDDNGTCAETLEMIKPNIFAKGGDRTPSNMPYIEIETCKRINCRIVYDVGGDKANHSSKVGEKVYE